MRVALTPSLSARPPVVFCSCVVFFLIKVFLTHIQCFRTCLPSDSMYSHEPHKDVPTNRRYHGGPTSCNGAGKLLPRSDDAVAGAPPTRRITRVCDDAGASRPAMLVGRPRAVGRTERQQNRLGLY